jgi:hypothetical protein
MGLGRERDRALFSVYLLLLNPFFVFAPLSVPGINFYIDIILSSVKHDNFSRKIRPNA